MMNEYTVVKKKKPNMKRAKFKFEGYVRRGSNSWKMKVMAKSFRAAAVYIKQRKYLNLNGIPLDRRVWTPQQEQYAKELRMVYGRVCAQYEAYDLVNLDTGEKCPDTF